MNKTRLLFLILAFALSGLTACTANAESVPNAWIDHPRDGDVFASGETIMIMSHVFAKNGVAEVVLSINGIPFRRDVPVEAGQDFVSIEQDWVTGEAGIYILQVNVYDTQGQSGNPAAISVEVIGGVAPDAPTPTLVVTPTLVPTGIPTNTPTLVPPTPTFVPDVPTYTPTSPPLPPADNTPPPAPTPAVPANGLELSCPITSQTLVWMPVTDPSGIDGYYVKLERESTPGNWVSAGGFGPVSGKQVDVPVDCGGRYRWMVRAQDGAGNYSAWSAPSSFSVSLN